MKRLLSLFAFAVLLVALGVLSYAALTGSTPALAQVDPVVFAGQAGPESLAQAAPAAPNAPDSLKLNEVALPLDVQSSFAVAGLTFDAEGLAQNITSGEVSVNQVAHWNPTLQQADTWDPNLGFGVVNGEFTITAFPLKTGEPYILTLNSVASNVYSIVGDVPEPGDIAFTWVGSANCLLNHFSVPLDQHPSVSGKDLSDADKLADDIGAAGIAQISQWNAPLEQSDTWDPGLGFGVVNGEFTITPFNVALGYPYWICALDSLDNQDWP